jgi:hypothetical protein
MSSTHPLPSSCHWVSALASALDPRSAPRLAWLLVGAVLARLLIFPLVAGLLTIGMFAYLNLKK